LQAYIYNVTVNVLVPSGSNWNEIPLDVRGEAIENVVRYSQKGASYTKKATKNLQENPRNRRKSKTRPWELERAGGNTNASPHAKPAEKVAKVAEMPEDITEGCVGEAVEAEPQPDSAPQIQDKGDTRALEVSGQKDGRNDGLSERDQLPKSDGQAVGKTQDLLEGTLDKILEQNPGEADPTGDRHAAGSTSQTLSNPKNPKNYSSNNVRRQTTYAQPSTLRCLAGRGTLAKFTLPRQTSAADPSHLAKKPFRSPLGARPAALAHRGRSLVTPAGQQRPTETPSETLRMHHVAL
jgi:hypothetical protein